MRHRVGALASLTALWLIACSDDADHNATKNNTKTPDMSAPADMRPGPDQPRDADMAPDADMDQAKACQLQADCAPTQSCLMGRCRESPACDAPSQWTRCVAALGELDPSMSERAACIDQRCRMTCILDSECASGQVCGDDGLCIPFEGTLTGKHPGAGQRGPLRAGVGDRLFHFPIGLPAAGYGGGNSRGGRYTSAMSETWGTLHALTSRALVLDNGERQLAIVRLPIIFPTGPMHEAVAQRLQQATGADWRDSLVISATHTHSGPGRLFHLPPPEGSLIPLGVLGTDLFHQEAFDWYVEDIAQTVLDALADLAPAKLSWQVLESFDTDDHIASDRWGSTPPFDDNRVLLMRVDDLEDKPRAVMMSFGMHGTWNTDRAYLSEDAAGSVERGLERRLGQAFGRFVPTLFINANGGSMSPRGDNFGHRQGHKFDWMGERFAQKVWPTVQAMQGKTEVSLGGVTHRFPIRLSDMPYKDGEFVDLRRRTESLRYGGIQCSVANAEDNDYTTYADPSSVRCLGIHTIMYNRPPTIFTRSQVSALEIDGLTMVTLPGESVVELGWQMARALRDEHGIDPLKSWVIGYAQDHKFYLTPSNLRGERPPYPGLSLPMAPDDYPDYAISYFQGGYEPGFMPWGHHFAQFLQDRIVESVAKLRGTPMQMALPEVLPMSYSRRPDPAFGVERSTAALGTVLEQPPEQVKRLTAIEFAWVGGDPGAELPQVPRVILEREQTPGQFVAVTQPNQRPYDNRDALMVTRTRKGDQDWEWIVYWEELKDFPAGRYRFSVQGHAQQERGREPYAVTSRPFEVIPSDALVVTLEAEAGVLRGTLAYPAAPALRVVGPLQDLGKVEGSYRMRHARVPTGSPDPLVADQDVTSAQITLSVVSGGQGPRPLSDASLKVSTEPERVDNRDGVPVTRFEQPLAQPLEPGTYELLATVTDAYGNTGRATLTVTIP